MKFLFIEADQPHEKNCSVHNCERPAIAINKTAGNQADIIHISAFTQNPPEVQELCKSADIIIVERNLFGDTLPVMQFWKCQGKSLGTIWDDAYGIIEPENASYTFWNAGIINGVNDKGEPVTFKLPVLPLIQLKWGVQMAKGSVFPSPILAKDWEPYAQKTYVTHNYLQEEIYENMTPLIPHDDILVGWHGSMSHFESFTNSGVLSALLRVARKYNNVRILIGGDKRIYDRVNLPENKKVYQPFVPENQWPNALKNIDIGICPLGSEYDKRRSWIKALEYMIAKTPWIATDYPTYYELRDYGKLIENGSKNWESALTEVIEEFPKYKQFAETTAYDFAKTQTWDKNIHKVIDIYRQIAESEYN